MAHGSGQRERILLNGGGGGGAPLARKGRFFVAIERGVAGGPASSRSRGDVAARRSRPVPRFWRDQWRRGRVPKITPSSGIASTGERRAPTFQFPQHKMRPDAMHGIGGGGFDIFFRFFFNREKSVVFREMRYLHAADYSSRGFQAGGPFSAASRSLGCGALNSTFSS